MPVFSALPDVAGRFVDDVAEDDSDDDEGVDDDGVPGWSTTGALCFRRLTRPVVSDTRRWMYSARRWSAARISVWDAAFPCLSASGEHGPCWCTMGILVVAVAALGLCSEFQVQIGVRFDLG